ncbi:unnamed protein product [Nesidiocoris tenuis]|uniref:Uncharacterized protein n=1 Tax=Nesidiocoris tenuis TaxID=355587 RepID=A0A6H5G5I5_9HEMI|nr:unnamed protein product [Nesidiocoris tenuis]
MEYDSFPGIGLASLGVMRLRGGGGGSDCGAAEGVQHQRPAEQSPWRSGGARSCWCTKGELQAATARPSTTTPSALPAPATASLRALHSPRPCSAVLVM